MNNKQLLNANWFTPKKPRWLSSWWGVKVVSHHKICIETLLPYEVSLLGYTLHILIFNNLNIQKYRINTSDTEYLANKQPLKLLKLKKRQFDPLPV